MKPNDTVDISPKFEMAEIRGKQTKTVKIEQLKIRSTLEVARKPLLQLDELDMILTNRGTYYFQN